MHAPDRWFRNVLAALLAAALVLGVLAGCAKEETPPPSTGFYKGSDFKGKQGVGPAGQAGRQEEKSPPAAAGR